MAKKNLGNGFVVIDHQLLLHFDKVVYGKLYPYIDFPSFEIIQSNGSTYHYFKDKKHVYLESYMNRFAILPDADPADFRILDFEKGMATSRGNDYVFDQKLVYRLADVKELGGVYQKVGDAIYCAYFQQVEAADAATFEVLHAERIGNLSRDKNHVYFRQQVVKEADAKSFRVLAECVAGTYYREADHTFYAVDKQQAFYIDTIARAVKPLRTKSLEKFRFEVHDGLGYALDADYCYRFGKRHRLEGGELLNISGKQ